MKMIKYTSIFLILFLGLESFDSKEPSDKNSSARKYERRILKADRFFNNFIYPKAIEQYEKAIRENDGFDAYSYLQIANSYRLMNMPQSAEVWYSKIEDDGIMRDQDYMHYAQVLLGNGKEDRARMVVSRIQQKEELDLERLTKLDYIEQYFRDSLAFFIENMPINSEEADFGPTYFEKGIAFVSNRKTKKVLQGTYAWDDTYFLDLYYTEIGTDGVSKPKAFSDRLNTVFHEGPSVFYDNNNKVIFTRNNFNLGRTRTSLEGVNKLKLYYAERTGKKKKWSKAEPLPFNSDEYAVGHPTLTKDGQTLYFSSDMSDSFGEADIFRSQWIDGNWSEPENLGNVINTSEDELFPYISSTNTLYFASAGHAGIGGLDIYSVDLNAAELKVVNMGYPINTKSDDFGMILEGEAGYFSSDRDGGKGSDDIYALTIYKLNLVINLVDADTGEKIQGGIRVVDRFDGREAVKVSDASSASISTFRGRNYRISGESPGYEANEIDFSTVVVPAGAGSYEVNVPLIRPRRESNVVLVHIYGKEDQTFADLEGIKQYEGSFEELKADYAKSRVDIATITELHAVYYDFDSSDIREDADANLRKLKMVLETYPELKVQLIAHADSRGSDHYNDRLSKRRVEAARDYLQLLGVAPHRMQVDHLGENQLVNSCDNEEECSEDEHQLNRRTEITLLKKH